MAQIGAPLPLLLVFFVELACLANFRTFALQKYILFMIIRGYVITPNEKGGLSKSLYTLCFSLFSKKHRHLVTSGNSVKGNTTAL